MAEITITEENFDQVVLKSDRPVLVDFWAPWCGPCMMLGPVIEELAREFEGKAKVGKVNVDENRQLALKFGIMSIPALLFFKDGKEVERLIGLQSKEVLVEKLKKYC